jgi:SPP1 family predicted phage head-tail adaptor
MKIEEFNPGLLNKKLQILKQSKDSDGAGGFKKVLTLEKTVWANIRAINGTELWEAQQTQARITHRITIRYMKDINRTYALMYNNRVFDIQFIINLNEADRFLELQVVERQ